MARSATMTVSARPNCACPAWWSDSLCKIVFRGVLLYGVGIDNILVIIIIIVHFGHDQFVNCAFLCLLGKHLPHLFLRHVLFSCQRCLGSLFADRGLLISCANKYFFNH